MGAPKVYVRVVRKVQGGEVIRYQLFDFKGNLLKEESFEPSLYPNSHLQRGTDYGFTGTSNGWQYVELYSGPEAYSAGFCMKCLNTAYRKTYWSDVFIEVDEVSNYQFSVMLKTLTANGNGDAGSGYFGFTPFNAWYEYITPNTVYWGSGATVLTRDLNLGDTKIYVADTTGWDLRSPSNRTYQSFLVFPPDHPVYGNPYQHSGISHYYGGADVVWTGTDWEIPIINSAYNPTTISTKITGYDTTAGTPVSWSRSGGGHQYVLGSQTSLPYEWTKYESGVLTGRGFSDANTFRWGTKYVKFLALLNYHQNGTPQAEFLMDNFIMKKV